MLAQGGAVGADLAIHDDRKAALHLCKALRRDRRNAAAVDCVLDRLAPLLEQRCWSDFVGRQLYAGEIGGMIHPLQQDQPPASSTTATTPAR
jgi:hypothetical protein